MHTETKAPPADLGQLQTEYILEPAARPFLETRPGLVAVLVDAYPHLAAAFGGRPRVRLELAADPESDGCEAVAYVVTNLPADEALSRLEAFDRAWLIDNLQRTHGELTFNLG